MDWRTLVATAGATAAAVGLGGCGDATNGGDGNGDDGNGRTGSESAGTGVTVLGE